MQWGGFWDIKRPAVAARSTFATIGAPFASKDTETEPSTLLSHLPEEGHRWGGVKTKLFKRSKISGQGRGFGGEKRAFFELTVRLEVVLVLPWLVPLPLLHLLLLLAQAACSWPHGLGDHWLQRNY